MQNSRNADCQDSIEGWVHPDLKKLQRQVSLATAKGNNKQSAKQKSSSDSLEVAAHCFSVVVPTICAPLPPPPYMIKSELKGFKNEKSTTNNNTTTSASTRGTTAAEKAAGGVFGSMQKNVNDPSPSSAAMQSFLVPKKIDSEANLRTTEEADDANSDELTVNFDRKIIRTKQPAIFGNESETDHDEVQRVEKAVEDLSQRRRVDSNSSKTTPETLTFEENNEGEGEDYYQLHTEGSDASATALSGKDESTSKSNANRGSAHSNSKVTPNSADNITRVAVSSKASSSSTCTTIVDPKVLEGEQVLAKTKSKLFDSQLQLELLKARLEEAQRLAASLQSQIETHMSDNIEPLEHFSELLALQLHVRTSAASHRHSNSSNNNDVSKRWSDNKSEFHTNSSSSSGNNEDGGRLVASASVPPTMAKIKGIGGVGGGGVGENTKEEGDEREQLNDDREAASMRLMTTSRGERRIKRDRDGRDDAVKESEVVHVVHDGQFPLIDGVDGDKKTDQRKPAVPVADQVDKEEGQEMKRQAADTEEAFLYCIFSMMRRSGTYLNRLKPMLLDASSTTYTLDPSFSEEEHRYGDDAERRMRSSNSKHDDNNEFITRYPTGLKRLREEDTNHNKQPFDNDANNRRGGSSNQSASLLAKSRKAYETNDREWSDVIRIEIKGVHNLMLRCATNSILSTGGGDGYGTRLKSSETTTTTIAPAGVVEEDAGGSKEVEAENAFHDLPGPFISHVLCASGILSHIRFLCGELEKTRESLNVLRETVEMEGEDEGRIEVDEKYTRDTYETQDYSGSKPNPGNLTDPAESFFSGGVYPQGGGGFVLGSALSSTTTSLFPPPQTPLATYGGSVLGHVPPVSMLHPSHAYPAPLSYSAYPLTPSLAQQQDTSTIPMGLVNDAPMNAPLPKSPTPSDAGDEHEVANEGNNVTGEEEEEFKARRFSESVQLVKKRITFLRDFARENKTQKTLDGSDAQKKWLTREEEVEENSAHVHTITSTKNSMRNEKESEQQCPLLLSLFTVEHESEESVEAAMTFIREVCPMLEGTTIVGPPANRNEQQKEQRRQQGPNRSILIRPKYVTPTAPNCLFSSKGLLGTPVTDEANATSVSESLLSTCTYCTDPHCPFSHSCQAAFVAQGTLLFMQRTKWMLKEHRRQKLVLYRSVFKELTSKKKCEKGKEEDWRPSSMKAKEDKVVPKPTSLTLPQLPYVSPQFEALFALNTHVCTMIARTSLEVKALTVMIGAIAKEARRRANKEKENKKNSRHYRRREDDDNDDYHHHHHHHHRGRKGKGRNDSRTEESEEDRKEIEEEDYSSFPFKKHRKESPADRREKIYSSSSSSSESSDDDGAENGILRTPTTQNETDDFKRDFVHQEHSSSSSSSKTTQSSGSDSADDDCPRSSSSSSLTPSTSSYSSRSRSTSASLSSSSSGKNDNEEYNDGDGDGEDSSNFAGEVEAAAELWAEWLTAFQYALATTAYRWQAVLAAAIIREKLHIVPDLQTEENAAAVGKAATCVGVAAALPNATATAITTKLAMLSRDSLLQLPCDPQGVRELLLLIEEARNKGKGGGGIVFSPSYFGDRPHGLLSFVNSHVDGYGRSLSSWPSSYVLLKRLKKRGSTCVKKIFAVNFPPPTVTSDKPQPSGGVVNTTNTNSIEKLIFFINTFENLWDRLNNDEDEGKSGQSNCAAAAAVSSTAGIIAPYVSSGVTRAEVVKFCMQELKAVADEKIRVMQNHHQLNTADSVTKSSDHAKDWSEVEPHTIKSSETTKLCNVDEEISLLSSREEAVWAALLLVTQTYPSFELAALTAELDLGVSPNPPPPKPSASPKLTKSNPTKGKGGGEEGVSSQQPPDMKMHYLCHRRIVDLYNAERSLFTTAISRCPFTAEFYWERCVWYWRNHISLSLTQMRPNQTDQVATGSRKEKKRAQQQLFDAVIEITQVVKDTVRSLASICASLVVDKAEERAMTMTSKNRREKGLYGHQDVGVEEGGTSSQWARPRARGRRTENDCERDTFQTEWKWKGDTIINNHRINTYKRVATNIIIRHLFFCAELAMTSYLEKDDDCGQLNLGLSLGQFVAVVSDIVGPIGAAWSAVSTTGDHQSAEFPLPASGRSTSASLSTGSGSSLLLLSDLMQRLAPPASNQEARTSSSSSPSYFTFLGDWAKCNIGVLALHLTLLVATKQMLSPAIQRVCGKDNNETETFLRGSGGNEGNGGEIGRSDPHYVVNQTYNPTNHKNSVFAATSTSTVFVGGADTHKSSKSKAGEERAQRLKFILLAVDDLFYSLSGQTDRLSTASSPTSTKTPSSLAVVYESQNSNRAMEDGQKDKESNSVIAPSKRQPSKVTTQKNKKLFEKYVSSTAHTSDQPPTKKVSVQQQQQPCIGGDRLDFLLCVVTDFQRKKGHGGERAKVTNAVIPNFESRRYSSETEQPIEWLGHNGVSSLLLCLTDTLSDLLCVGEEENYEPLVPPSLSTNARSNTFDDFCSERRQKVVSPSASRESKAVMDTIAECLVTVVRTLTPQLVVSNEQPPAGAVSSSGHHQSQKSSTMLRNAAQVQVLATSTSTAFPSSHPLPSLLTVVSPARTIIELHCDGLLQELLVLTGPFLSAETKATIKATLFPASSSGYMYNGSGAEDIVSLHDHQRGGGKKSAEEKAGAEGLLPLISQLLFPLPRNAQRGALAAMMRSTRHHSTQYLFPQSPIYWRSVEAFVSASQIASDCLIRPPLCPITTDTRTCPNLTMFRTCGRDHDCHDDNADYHCGGATTERDTCPASHSFNTTDCLLSCAENHMPETLLFAASRADFIRIADLMNKSEEEHTNKNDNDNDGESTAPPLAVAVGAPELFAFLRSGNSYENSYERKTKMLRSLVR